MYALSLSVGLSLTVLFGQASFGQIRKITIFTMKNVWDETQTQVSMILVETLFL